MSFYIVTDSAGDIPDRLVEKWGISVCRLSAHFNGRTYLDAFTEINMHDFYEALKNGQTSTTSQVNANQFEEVFRDKLKNHDKILYLGFAHVLSGTFPKCRHCETDPGRRGSIPEGPHPPGRYPERLPGHRPVGQ